MSPDVSVSCDRGRKTSGRKVATIGDAFMAVDGTDALLRGPVAHALQQPMIAN